MKQEIKNIFKEVLLLTEITNEEAVAFYFNFYRKISKSSLKYSSLFTIRFISKEMRDLEIKNNGYSDARVMKNFLPKLECIQIGKQGEWFCEIFFTLYSERYVIIDSVEFYYGGANPNSLLTFLNGSWSAYENKKFKVAEFIIWMEKVYRTFEKLISKTKNNATK